MIHLQPGASVPFLFFNDACVLSEVLSIEFALHLNFFSLFFPSLVSHFQYTGNSASRSRESPVIESRSTLDETSDTPSSTTFMYRMGDWINLNCSTSGDLAHLRWFINDKDVSFSFAFLHSYSAPSAEKVYPHPSMHLKCMSMSMYLYMSLCLSMNRRWRWRCGIEHA